MTTTLPQQAGNALMELIKGILTGLAPLILVLILKSLFFAETSIPLVAFSPLYHLRKYHARYEIFALQGTWSFFSLLEVGFPSRHFEDHFLCDGKLYSYKPLDPDQRMIRLLRVTRGRPGIYENKFGAKLVEVSLDSPAFKYLAIHTRGVPGRPRGGYTGYQWGMGNNCAIPKQIVCIFRTVLKPGRTIHLWIDAICIYVDRHRKENLGNLRLGPLLSEGFCFALVRLRYRFSSIPRSYRRIYSIYISLH